MQRTIAAVMSRNFVAVDIDDTVEKVESLIHSGNYPFIPVLGPGAKPFGVVSSTDLVHFHAGHGIAKRNRAWEICTHRVVHVPPDMMVSDVARLMREHKVHHVVVMENDRAVGVVDSLDLIDKLLLCD